MKSIYSLLSLFAIVALSCNKQVKKKVIPVEQKKETEKEEVVEKRWDSLKHDNVIPFFEAYGAQNKETKVKISTKFGDIKIRLYEDTPIHRANFLFLTKINYFSTTVFYRVDPGFVIQGGNSDNLDTRRIRYNYGNYLLPPEFKKHRKHKYGALAAARDWEKNPDKLSSPFEFYIIQGRKGGHHLDMEHTVFGEVYSGFSVMDKIANLEAGLDEWPKVDVYMKVEIID